MAIILDQNNFFFIVSIKINICEGHARTTVHVFVYYVLNLFNGT